MDMQMANYVGKLRAEKKTYQYSCDTTSSAVQVVNAPIPTELYEALQDMSTEFNRDPNCLAGDLLAIAVREALECLPENELAHLHDNRAIQELEETRRHMEQLWYDAGAP